MSSSTLTFSGTFTALVTPMDPSGINWEVLRALVEDQISAGIDGLVPVGTTGESPTLSPEEHLQVIRVVVEQAAGRVPVIAGTGANSTTEALHLTREADKVGADAFLHVAPYYNKPGQEGLVAHFSRIAEITHKPIVLYSIPGRCGIEIGIPTVARLAEDYPHIQAIKEASGSVARVLDLKSIPTDICVLSGDDGVTAPFVAAGASGVISVAANLAPSRIVEFTRACLENRFEDARKFYQQNRALLTDLVFMDGNPVTIKEALFQAGKLPSAYLRLPLIRTSKDNREKIRQLIENLNLQAPSLGQ